MSFYREGKVFFDRQEFIYAFYVFYFILEGLFGKENREVEKNFKSSLELQETIKGVLTKVMGIKNRHKNEILNLLGQKNLQYDVEGIIALLVRMRGHLHHFSRKSKLNQKSNPLAHQNYESLAVLTMAIAMQSILNEINKAKKSK